MKKFTLIVISIVCIVYFANAQWQGIPTPAFNDPTGNCSCTYLGEIASNSTFYWAHDVGCGNGSGFYSYYHIYKTTDSGLNWNLKVIGNYDYAGLYEIEFISQDTGYIVRNEYSAGSIYRTSNGMYSFQNCYYTVFPYYADIKMVNVNDMYAVDGYNNFYHLENDSFNVMHNFPSSLFLGYTVIEVTENNFIYLGCKSISGGPNSNNMILGSKDSGLSWDTLFFGTSKFINCIKFISDSIGFAIGDEGTVIKTINAGQTWVNKSTGLTNGLLSIDYMDNLTWIITGNFGLILISTDGGETWNNVDSPTNSALIKAKFPEKNEMVFIQSEDHIWKANIANLITDVPLHNDLQDHFNIYPNPAKDHFTIEIKNPKIKNTSTEIYNLFGDKVFSLNISHEQKIIDCSILPKGIYLVRVVNQGYYSTQRLVIQ